MFCGTVHSSITVKLHTELATVFSRNYSQKQSIVFPTLVQTTWQWPTGANQPHMPHVISVARQILSIASKSFGQHVWQEQPENESMARRPLLGASNGASLRVCSQYRAAAVAMCWAFWILQMRVLEAVDVLRRHVGSQGDKATLDEYASLHRCLTSPLMQNNAVFLPKWIFKVSGTVLAPTTLSFGFCDSFSRL